MSGWLIETLVATTILLALVLLVRRPVAQAFGPRVAYALWLLPFLRMLLPPLPGGLFSISVMQADRSNAAAADHAALPILLTIWAVGALIFFVWQVLVYLRFANKARDRATGLYQEGRVEIRQDTQAGSPLAYGIFSKSVLLPADFAERFEHDEQYFAIRHELSHHARGDLVANLFALTLLSLNWFNPLAYMAFRAYRADQEAACDATVLADASDDDCQAYGRALVKSAVGRAPLVACPIGVAEGLKERLGHIVAARDVAPLYQAGMMLSGVAIVAGLGFTASGADGAASVPQRVAGPQVAVASSAESIPVSIRLAPKTKAARSIIIPQVKLAELEPRQERPKVAAFTNTANIKAQQPTPKIEPVAPSPKVFEVASPNAAAIPVTETKFALAGMGCNDGNQALISSEAIFDDGIGQGRIAFVLCGRIPTEGTDRRALLLGGLQTARAQIASDPSLPLMQRSHLIAVIDMQIEQVADIPV